MLSTLKKLFDTDNLNKIHKKYYKKDTRKCILNINDTLAYSLIYTSKNTTKSIASKNVNFDTQKNASVNAFYEQSKKYSLQFYEEILDNLNKNYLLHTQKYKSKNYIIKNRLNGSLINNDVLNSFTDCIYLLVDGTCNNSYKNHKLQTTNSLYIYDYLNNTCIDTYSKNKLYSQRKKATKKTTKTKTGKKRANYEQSNKNNEVCMFIDYLNSHHEKLKKLYKNKTIIFVCDKAYHSSKLFYALDNYNFKFVIRLKDNNLISQTTKTKNKDILYMRKHMRCVFYEQPLQFKFTDSNNKQKICNMKTEYHLLTNLNDTKLYTSNVLKKIYQTRWYIETFFKFGKSNTKMGFMKEKTQTKQKIMRICVLIVNILIKYLIHIYMSSSTFNERKKYKTFLNDDCLRTINYSCLINGMYEKCLVHLVKNKYSQKKIISFMDCYFCTINNKQNRSFLRESLIPFSKWYVKKYHKIYNLHKIINAIFTKTVDDLNKNLKTQALKIFKYITFDVA